MSGYYLFFRYCPNLNTRFPAKELDEVREEDLPTALDTLARVWLEQHPKAPAAYQRDLLLRLQEASEKLIHHAGHQASLSHKTPVQLPADEEDMRESGETGRSLNSLRWAFGTDPDEPLICRVARYAGWGHPLPQPMFRGQVVSERCFFARAPDRTTADSAIKYIRRLAAKSLDRDWMRPHFGYCAESGFTKQERETIEITYDLIDLLSDNPSFIQNARHVLDKVVEVAARFEKKPPDDQKKRALRGPGVDECYALLMALLTLLPQDQHKDVTDKWSAQEIANKIADKLKLDRAPSARTIQRMLVKEGYRQPRGTNKPSDNFSDTYWDDPDHPQLRRIGR